MVRAQPGFQRIARLGAVGALDGKRVERHDDAFALPDLFALFETRIDQRVQHHAAGIRLVGHLRQLPALAPALDQLARIVTAAEHVEEAAQPLERPRRTLEAVGCEQCGGKPVARGEAGVEHARHAAEDFHQAGGLRRGDAEGMDELLLVQLENFSGRAVLQRAEFSGAAVAPNTPHVLVMCQPRS